MNKFTETGLIYQIIKAIDELGFNLPTPIQKKTIPCLLNSENDLIALAQTGTGKTAAFGLPIIQKILKDQKKPISIILCPTRELCIQITKDLKKYSKYLSHIKITSIYGGVSIEEQIKSLKKGSQIIVGTPGRLLDIIRRKKIDLLSISYLVLDEADEMLNMGFKDELDAIIKSLPSKRQTLLFSATMSSDMNKIAKKYLNNPIEINIKSSNSFLESIKHFFYIVNNQNRYLALKRISDINPDIYGIVFCRTRKETKEISDNLIKDGYNADALYGDLSQSQRDSVMSRFREKRLQLLVATDVAARGLDVNNITHVINYNLPDDNETYIHRSGRTGRAGNKGISISIIHFKEKNRLKELEKKIGKKIEYNLIPTGKEICEKQLFHLINKITKVIIDNPSIEVYLPIIYDKLKNFNREDLIKRFASVEFNRFLNYYKNSKDININFDSFSAEKKNISNRKSYLNFSKLSINIGSKNNFSKIDLINFINKNIYIKKINIGKIIILDKKSIFEIDNKYKNNIISDLNKKIYQGKKIFVELFKENNKFFSYYKKKKINKKNKFYNKKKNKYK